MSWGRVENFKCVDYFQIEYYQTQDRQVSTTKPRTDRCGNHRLVNTVVFSRFGLVVRALVLH